MPLHPLVFVDVDTQIDFMLPDGNLYVPGAERIIPNLQRVTAYAAERGIPVVSSVDAHSPNDPEFQQFPPHCVKGTPGQEKLPQTLLSQRIVIPNERQELPQGERLPGIQQWILEKQTFDVSSNVNFASLLDKLDAGQFIVFGVATEYCVRLAVKGLLERSQRVALLLDGIREIDAVSGQEALRQMQKDGVESIRAEQVLATSLPIS